MFYLLPTVALIAVYLVAALLPAWFLLRYIYRQDTVEREPPALLAVLALSGVGAALVSIVLERLGQGILSSFMDEGSPAYTIVFAFLVVAAVEEGAKFCFLKSRTWRNPNFNFRFDAIVYAVFVSLGFAAFENVQYVLSYGLSVAAPRALLAIPGHMGFAVFMGVFYGRAKLCENHGDQRGKRANLWWGYLVAVLLHGFYDACAMIGTLLSTALFLGFVAVMYVVVYRVVRRESMGDLPLW